MPRKLPIETPTAAEKTALRQLLVARGVLVGHARQIARENDPSARCDDLAQEVIDYVRTLPKA